MLIFQCHLPVIWVLFTKFEITKSIWKKKLHAEVSINDRKRLVLFYFAKKWRINERDWKWHTTGCQEIDVPLPFECKIIMSPFLVTLWCCTSMEARQRLCFSKRSLVPVCMCCCASSTGSFVRVLIYQKLQCHYGEGVHLFDTVQGCGSTWSG